mmetsp:Transcript_2247/g.5257  ORF Transcript_2247/g.5257 Transcript_2247/m.5257 type:complete len:307 (-) Transcript_2247:618-1538(-)
MDERWPLLFLDRPGKRTLKAIRLHKASHPACQTAVGRSWSNPDQPKHSRLSRLLLLLSQTKPSPLSCLPGLALAALLAPRLVVPCDPTHPFLWERQRPSLSPHLGNLLNPASQLDWKAPLDDQLLPEKLKMPLSQWANAPALPVPQGVLVSLSVRSQGHTRQFIARSDRTEVAQRETSALLWRSQVGDWTARTWTPAEQRPPVGSKASRGFTDRLCSWTSGLVGDCLHSATRQESHTRTRCTHDPSRLRTRRRRTPASRNLECLVPRQAGSALVTRSCQSTCTSLSGPLLSLLVARCPCQLRAGHS